MSSRMTNTIDAGPSNLRHLVRQAQLPPLTIDQSALVHDVHDNSPGSPMSPSPKKNLSQEELYWKIEKYNAKIREYERNRDNKAKGKQNAPGGSNKINQKKVSCYNQKILDEMLIIMEQFNGKGFVYGMVTENGKPLTGASDSLREWWKTQVMFDKVGPFQIDQYYNSNAFYSLADIDNKSTTELLMELSDPTLGSILSLLMPHCDPPQREFPFGKDLQPPWWPTAEETWWGQTGISASEEKPPFRKPHSLRKKWKVTVIVGILKHMSPNFSRPYYLVEKSRYSGAGKRMSAKEIKFWTLALVTEARQYCQDHPDLSAEEGIEFLNEYKWSSCTQRAPYFLL